jgi:hypothetical protein
MYSYNLHEQENPTNHTHIDLNLGRFARTDVVLNTVDRELLEMAFVLPGDCTHPAKTTSRISQRPPRCSMVYDLSFVFLLQWRPRKRPSNHYPGGAIDRLGAQETKAARKQRRCVQVRRRRRTSDVPSVPWADEEEDGRDQAPVRARGPVAARHV